MNIYKTISAGILLFILPLISVAQIDKPDNIPTFDKKPWHFGFTLGYNSADFYMKMDPDFTFQDSLLSLRSVSQPGFNLGIVSSLNLSPGFRLRFIPALTFQDRLLEYTFLLPDGSTEVLDKRVESTFIDFPLNIKLRTMRVNNFAAYITAGAKYSIDMASQEEVTNNTGINAIVKIKKHDYAAEIGGGVDFFLTYFKFGIELKLSAGLPNVLIQDNNRFSSPIQSLRTKMWLLSFTFEG